MIKKYLFLAVKNLKRRGLRSWLTMLGIFIGIAAVVSLISLGSGLREAILGQFNGLETDKLTVTSAETGFGPPGSTAITKLTQHDVDVIKRVSGVDIVVPRLLRPVGIEYNKIASFGFAVSLPKEQDQIKIVYSTMTSGMEAGRLLTKEDRSKIVLGHDYVKLKTFDKDITVGSKIKLQGKEFEVVGILNPMKSFQFNQAILMPEEDMKDLLKIDEEYDLIAVQIVKGENITLVAENIKEKMRRDRNQKIGQEDFNVQSPVNALASVNTILNIINIIVIAIAAISLLVGGIGIANTMYTSVLERTKEIGVMKAIGARNSDILLIFISEAGLLGGIGGLVGAAIGSLMSFGLAFAINSALDTQLFIVSFSPTLILGSLAFSLSIGIISGIIPAIQASKLKPVDAFRN